MDPALVVLRAAGVQAERTHLEIELPPLESQHFRLHPPAVRVRERDRHPEVIGQPPSDGLVLLTLEEPLAGRPFLRLPQHREAQQLAVLIGEPEHLRQGPELAADRGADDALAAPRENVGIDVPLPEPGDPSAGKGARQVDHAAIVLGEIPRPGRLVVLPQFCGDVFVADPVGAGQNRLPGGDASLMKRRASAGGVSVSALTPVLSRTGRPLT